MGKVYDILRYYVVPPVFIPVFTCGSLVLVLLGADQPVSLDVILSRCFGNAFSWTVITILCLWSWGSLILPGPTTYGSASPRQCTPVYKKNGVFYYLVTVVVFISIMKIYPQLADALYHAHPEVVGTLNVLALALCVHLLIIGKQRVQYSLQEPRRPIMFEFYRGMEHHPRLLGVDVKQLSNCRIGVMTWQLLVIAFYVAATRRHGEELCIFVPCFIQTLYLAKFFWWEEGYFNTLDMTLDRAGYYICWGCLVLLPSLYTFSSYYVVSHPPISSHKLGYAALLLGITSIILNYRVDYEKYIFRRSSSYKCHLWGRPVKYIKAQYIDEQGLKRSSALLISGGWGVARHLNYTFEILAAISWTLPLWGLGIFPFLYVIFLVLLLLQRLHRDEEKCRKKYGKAWAEYSEKVPYRLIPHVF